jgi:UrcA family protein
MKRSLTTLLALFFAALTISSTCTAASADPGARLVGYDDLDLSQPTHVRILHKRIEQAANAMCLHATGPSPALTVDARCKSEAVWAAWARVRELVAKRQAALAAPSTNL